EPLRRWRRRGLRVALLLHPVRDRRRLVVVDGARVGLDVLVPVRMEPVDQLLVLHPELFRQLVHALLRHNPRSCPERQRTYLVRSPSDRQPALTARPARLLAPRSPSRRVPPRRSPARAAPARPGSSPSRGTPCPPRGARQRSART